MRKTITIKNAFISDKEYLDNLVIACGGSVADALNEVINIAINQKENMAIVLENTKETEKLKLENKRLTDELQRLSEENSKLINIPAKEIEVEKIIEVEKPLSGSQFICELEEKTAHDARKIRSWVVKDGYLDFENDKEYPNKLANVAVKFFINRHYIDLID